MHKGDWVLVWGQIKKIDETGVHPDDAIVEFFSHNEQWAGHVELDRIKETELVPGFASRCPHLVRTENGLYAHCVRHYDHGKKHASARGEYKWDDKDTAAYIELDS